MLLVVRLVAGVQYAHDTILGSAFLLVAFWGVWLVGAIIARRRAIQDVPLFRESAHGIRDLKESTKRAADKLWQDSNVD